MSLTRPNFKMHSASKSKLTPIDVALDSLLRAVPHVEEQESVEILQARGRVLAAECKSDLDVPPYANSAMDGYAIRVADLLQEPVTLPVRQRIAAGQTGTALAAGEAARIFTGAPIPPGADAVVIQENCSLNGALVTILQNVKKGSNLRQAGEDVAAGAILFTSGHRFRAQDIGFLASAGIRRVQVTRKLKVALMTTGNELVLPGNRLQPGQIYNSNFYTLSALLDALNVEVVDFGIVGDDLESTRKALRDAASTADCIISTGGVSVGEEDYVKAAVESEGSLDLWKLAIKPGKPLACGKISVEQTETQFFGLPGNPVSAFITFVLVVRPCLLRMLGCSSPLAQTFKLSAGFERSASGERQEYLRSVIVAHQERGREILPYTNQSSGVGASLSHADGLAIIPSYTSVAIGDSLDFIPFSEILN